MEWIVILSFVYSCKSWVAGYGFETKFVQKRQDFRKTTLCDERSIYLKQIKTVMKGLDRKCLVLLFIVSAILVLFYIFHVNNTKQIISLIRDKTKWTNLTPFTQKSLQPQITLAVVACGQRLHETLTMIKSVLLFNQGTSFLRFIVITEESLKVGFEEKLTDWQEVLPNQFVFELFSLKFPEKNAKEWKTLFKPCAAQRLFLPSLLPHIDSVLYVDTDTLFLSPISETWDHFKHFNSSQIAGLSPEHEDTNVGWYNRFARHPFYEPLGINSGVMLMNLTRMREFDWEERILPIHKEYKMKITWGDQDLINILFYFHSDKLYVFSCEYNYRPDHCMYMSVCNASNGVQILHGNRGYFHADKQPAFSTIYRAVESYQVGKEPYRNFFLPLESALADETVANSNCGKVSNQFLIKARKLFPETDYYYS